MTLFIISIPLMALAVAIAVVPLIAMSRADHRHRQEEFLRRKRQLSGQVVPDDDEALPFAA